MKFLRNPNSFTCQKNLKNFCYYKAAAPETTSMISFVIAA